MNAASVSSSLLFLLLLVNPALGDTKCSHVTGRLICHRDPLKAAFAQVRVYDKDGLFWPIPSFFDPDDFMGVTFSGHDGKFEVHGCGYDPNWLFIRNWPDPYLQIRHYCDSVEGDILELGEFDIFTPQTYEAGDIGLDEPAAGEASITRKVRPIHPKARIEDEGCLMGKVSQVEVGSPLCRFSNMARMGHSCNVLPGAEPALPVPSWVSECPKDWIESSRRVSGAEVKGDYHRHPFYVKRCIWEVSIEGDEVPSAWDIPTWSELCEEDVAPSTFQLPV